MTLSILIVNWNSCDYLRSCLMSIRETCSHLEPQIVVVDGGSFDGSCQMLKSEFAEVDFVQSQENIGFGRSNNLGFLSVKGEAVLLLNPDTEVRPEAVENLLVALQTIKNAGLVGALLLNSDHTLQLSSFHPLPTPLKCAFDSEWLRRRWWKELRNKPEGSPVPVEAVSGACMMIRSETFRHLGGFSAQFFMYAEDMDLCLKVQRAGLDIYHIPKAVVTHHGGGSSSTLLSKFSVVMIREALCLYMRLNHGSATVILFRCLVAISSCGRISILAILSIFTTGSKSCKILLSIKQWWAVLRWSVGLESWAAGYFKSHDEEMVSADERNSAIVRVNVRTDSEIQSNGI